MTTLIVAGMFAALVALLGQAGAWVRRVNRRERAEARFELATRTGEHRIVPLPADRLPYPDEVPRRARHRGHRAL